LKSDRQAEGDGSPLGGAPAVRARATRSFKLHLSADELAVLHSLAAARGVSAASLLRQLIRREAPHLFKEEPDAR
jgi:hypothetical protein